MFPYVLATAVLFPGVAAVFFLFNKNSQLQRAAVFFVSIGLFLGVGWAVGTGKGFYQPAGDFSRGLEYFFVAGNVALLAGLGYWSRRWRDWLLGVLTLAQGVLLVWILMQAGKLGLVGSFAMDRLSGLLLLLVNGVGAMILLFSLDSLETSDRRRFLPKSRRSPYFALLALALGAMNGLILSNQLLWLLFFWQSIAYVSCLLIAQGRTRLALQGASRLLRMTAIGSVAFLVGTGLLFSVAGTLLLSELMRFREASLLLLPLACFVVAGMAFSGQFPFQNALRGTDVAAAPVAALLQTCTMVSAGGYLILRLSPLFMNTWLAKMAAVIGAFSFAAAALLAALQRTDKRVQALMTVSSLGLVLTLACIPEVQAIYAAILLLVWHGAAKALLLLCADRAPSSRFSANLVLLGGLAMLLPPFVGPVAQWTALGASVRNPVALGLMIAGCVFWMIVWTRYVGACLTSVIAGVAAAPGSRLAAAAQLILSAAVIGLSAFSVPFTNYYIAPVLTENFARFEDVAQGKAGAFLIQDFSGVNPEWLLAAVGVAFGVGWAAVKLAAVREPEPTAAEEPEETRELEEAEETGEPAEPAEELLTGSFAAPEPETANATPAEVRTAPRASIFAAFPDERQTERYATMISGAMILLMLEVLFR